MKILFSYPAALIIFVGTMEICARIDDRVRFNAPLTGDYESGLLRTNDKDGIRHNAINASFEKWRINNFGFRGDDITLVKKPGVTRIAVVGSSETFGLYEDSGEEWPHQLMRMLRPEGIEVINAAVAGMTLDRYEIYIAKYVLPLDPDIIILYVNPYFHVMRMHELESNKPKTKNKMPDVRPVQTRSDAQFKPRILRKLKTSVKRVIPPALLNKYQIKKMSESVKHAENRYLKGKKPIDEIPPDYIDTFKQELIHLIEFLHSKGIKLVLSSYPVMITKANIAKHMNIFLDARRFTPVMSFDGMINAPRRYNQALKKVAALYGVEYVDNYSVIPKNTQYFGDNVHYTNKGAELIASMFAQRLRYWNDAADENSFPNDGPDRIN
jgi:lysophospholipase L1-like esterase